MTPVKKFINIESSATLAEFQPQAKALADAYKLENPDYDCILYTFVEADSKVVRSFSSNTRVFVDDMSKYPLNTNQKGLITELAMSYSSTDIATIPTINDAINIATTLADKFTYENLSVDGITIIKLYDRVQRSGVITILPSMFSTSLYIGRSVKVGTSTYDVNDVSTAVVPENFIEAPKNDSIVL